MKQPKRPKKITPKVFMDITHRLQKFDLAKERARVRQLRTLLK